MLAGATLADPARIDVRGEVRVERDVFIDINAVLIGKVRLGARVKIGPTAVFAIRASARTPRFTQLPHRRRGSRGQLAGLDRLPAAARDGTASHVHVGNFVEVKNSDIGAGAKANHLSYLGDAQVGRDVNVGAAASPATTTAANKWPTIIEDGAFIGSGSMLVAPVRVGAQATIGAGSTIAQNAPDGELTLTRAKQPPSRMEPAGQAFGKGQRSRHRRRAAKPKSV